jgi:hypothetical protein
VQGDALVFIVQVPRYGGVAGDFNMQGNQASGHTLEKINYSVTT